MKIEITEAAQVGRLIRAVRKTQRLRQDDAAGSIGVSENFLGKVEAGAGRVQWDKLFLVLRQMGIRVELELPNEVEPVAARLTGDG
jgi:transcriptional regulator with XRE-family HTH domain